MRAIMQEGFGSPDVLTLREVERPDVAPDHVLVRVLAASVNAMDAHLIHLPLPRWLSRFSRPKTVGVDLAGIVESVGAGVTRFTPGDAVFGAARGAFAEFASARQDRLAAKPASLSYLEAAAIPVAGLSALQALR